MREKQIKVSLFAEDMFPHVKPKDSIRKLLGVINNFSRAPEFKTNTKVSVERWRVQAGI